MDTAIGRVMPTIAVVVAAALQLMVGFYTFTAIGLISVPLWGIVLLSAAWIGAVVLLVRTARRKPLVAPLVPMANAAFLWVVLTIGDVAFGWTA